MKLCFLLPARLRSDSGVLGMGPFRSCLGVELSPTTHQTACCNNSFQPKIQLEFPLLSNQGVESRTGKSCAENGMGDQCLRGRCVAATRIDSSRWYLAVAGRLGTRVGPARALHRIVALGDLGVAGRVMMLSLYPGGKGSPEQLGTRAAGVTSGAERVSKGTM